MKPAKCVARQGLSRPTQQNGWNDSCRASLPRLGSGPFARRMGSCRLSLGRECDYLMSTDWAARPSGTSCRSDAWPKSRPILV